MFFAGAAWVAVLFQSPEGSVGRVRQAHFGVFRCRDDVFQSPEGSVGRVRVDTSGETGQLKGFSPPKGRLGG